MRSDITNPNIIEQWLADEKCFRRYGQTEVADLLKRCREDLEKCWREHGLGRFKPAGAVEHGGPNPPSSDPWHINKTRGGSLDDPGPVNRMLRVWEVLERVGVSRATLWRMERTGNFPRSRRISKNAVGWFEREIEAWLQSRPTS